MCLCLLSYWVTYGVVNDDSFLSLIRVKMLLTMIIFLGKDDITAIIFNERQREF